MAAGMFVVAPASSFHHHHDAALISAESAAAANSAATTLGVGVGVGVIPLLTATPCLNMTSAADEGAVNNMLSGRSRGGGGIHLWQNQLPSSQHHYYMRKPLDHVNSNFIHSSGGGGGGGMCVGDAGTTGSSTTTCQDCGNQAKKDCSFRRCRTCCKSRGFDCSTHVRSTWVSASRRRERQLINTASAGAGSSTSTSGTKKPRLMTNHSQTTTTNSHTSTSNTATPPRSFDTAGSSRQDGWLRESLPGQVRAPAVFKCVRVTAVEEGEDEYAYQGVVKIGGHVFKGFLYDQGRSSSDHEQQQAAGAGFPNISELHLGSSSSSPSPIINPHHHGVYASSSPGSAAAAALLGGSTSTYGNQLN